MPQESYLEKKLRQLGLSQEGGGGGGAGGGTSGTSGGLAGGKKLQFKLFFPRAPYGQVEYSAARQGDGLNFVGQLLGHGGSTLKRVQQESGARVEVHDAKGNLNGTHPSYTDPSLHAVVYADNKEKLTKAARLIAEVLQPVNASYEWFEVSPGGSALLRPKAGALANGKIVKTPPQNAESSTRDPPLPTTWKNLSKPSNGLTRGIRPPNGASSSLRSCGSDSGTKSTGTLTPTSEASGIELRNQNTAAGSLRPTLSMPISQEQNRFGVDALSAKSAKHETNHGGASQQKEIRCEQSKQEEQGQNDGGLQGMREWDTWGKNHQEPYNQFTAATQSFFSEYASRSRLMREQQNMAGSFPEMVSPLASSIPDSTRSGPVARVNSYCYGMGASCWTPVDLGQGPNMLDDRREPFVLPDLYSDIIDRNSMQSESLESSRLLSHYIVNLDKEQKDKVEPFMDVRRVPVPHTN